MWPELGQDIQGIELKVLKRRRAEATGGMNLYLFCVLFNWALWAPTHALCLLSL